MRVVCILLSPGTLTKSLAECCLRLSPQVALGEHWIFLEVGKCQKLFSEESVLKRIRVILSKFGFFARLSIADDMSTALAFARYQTKNKNNLPVNALKDYLNPFGYTHTLEKMLSQLDKLGIYTLEDFIRLPRKTLVTRFKKEGLLAAQHLNEADQIIWPHFKVQEKIQESLILSTAPEALEALLFYIKTLTDRVASRLMGRGERVSRFQLSIHQEKFSHIKKPLREFIFDLPLAQSAGVSLLSIIRERLNTSLSKEPLQSDVEFLELKVLDSIPIRTSQKDFLNRNEEEREAWASLIGRLTEKLGPSSAFVARLKESYVPEKSWMRGMTEDSETEKNNKLSNVSVAVARRSSATAIRPLRILKDPLLVKRDGAKLWEPHSNSSWQILSIEGPEIVREEWWQLGTERDYYQIQTRAGDKLWVFQRSDGLYLHGLFD